MPDAERRDTLEMTNYLAKAGEEKRLQSLLTNFDFLDAKISVLPPQQLIADYDLAFHPNLQISEEKLDNLKLIQGALRLSANVLADDPTQLAGQLIGRLMHYTLLDEEITEPKSFWDTPPVLLNLIGYTSSVIALLVSPLLILLSLTKLFINLFLETNHHITDVKVTIKRRQFNKSYPNLALYGYLYLIISFPYCTI